MRTIGRGALFVMEITLAFEAKKRLASSMPWIKATLRGQSVYARADANGKLAPAPDGRVEIRYKANDGKAYHARATNLDVPSSPEVLADDTCVEAGAAPPKSEASGAKKKTNGAKKSTADADTRPIPKDAFIAYADGACTGNPGPCGLGLVLVAPDGKMREGFEYLGEGTNNIAELTAILRAVEAAPKDASGLVIHTDSQYSIGVLSKGWKAKANQALIADVKKALASFGKATLRYVPGHAGVPLNEKADELAREAVKSRASKPL
jgi:ribonuclease HI